MSEEIEYRVGARIDDLQDIDSQFKKSDAFDQSWDELKNLSGGFSSIYE